MTVCLLRVFKNSHSRSHIFCIHWGLEKGRWVGFHEIQFHRLFIGSLVIWYEPVLQKKKTGYGGSFVMVWAHILVPYINGWPTGGLEHARGDLIAPYHISMSTFELNRNDNRVPFQHNAQNNTSFRNPKAHRKKMNWFTFGMVRFNSSSLPFISVTHTLLSGSLSWHWLVYRSFNLNQTYIVSR